MTLASGAHVKIGSYEFMLDEVLQAGGIAGGSLYQPHYKHTFESLFYQGQQGIVGMATKNDVHPTRLIWSWDDWSGGEGNRIYYPDDPTVYEFSNACNPRIRGELTGRPNRTLTASTLTTADVTKRPSFAVSQGMIWYGGSYRIGYYNGSSWQVVDSTGTDATDFTQIQSKTSGTSYAITAMTGDSSYMYYSAWRSGGSGTRLLLAKTADNTNKAGPITAEASSKNPYAGMCMMNGRLYCWTGAALREHDVFNLTGTTPTALSADQIRVVGNTGVDPTPATSFSSSWWANCVASENTVFAFYSTAGQSTIYQFSNKGGFGPLWSGPIGFTIKCMQYQNGVLFVAGHWGGDSNKKGRGAMYAIPLDTLKPVFVNWFRKTQDLNLQMQEMCNSYGAQIMVAASHTGRIFVYDAETDGVSCLDSIATSGGDSMTATDALSFTANNHRIGDMMTFGTSRMAMIYQPGGAGAGNYQLLEYDDDEPNNRQAGTATGSAISDLESGDWDYDLPFEQKSLMGFDVSFQPLVTGQSFRISYSLDKAAYVDLTAVDFNHADSQKGRTFIQVSDGTTTTKFTSLRVKVRVTGTSGVKPPIILNISTEAQLTTYDQVWEIIVRLKDDQNHQKSGKRQVKGSTQRDWLLGVVANKGVVTFLDGYRYQLPGNYTTHTVTIEDPEDIIFRKGEGSMKMKLRTVPT